MPTSRVALITTIKTKCISTKLAKLAMYIIISITFAKQCTEYQNFVHLFICVHPTLAYPTT